VESLEKIPSQAQGAVPLADPVRLSLESTDASYAIAREDAQPMAFAGLWESLRGPDETVTRSLTMQTASK
jgi:putative SOS response-associated peptidase YedK